MPSRSFIETFPATSILLLLCVGFYALEAIDQDREGQAQGIRAGRGDLLRSLVSLQAIDGHVARDLGSNMLWDIRRGEVWRLLSSAFLHGSLLHLIMNGMALLNLGRFCEPFLGTRRFTVVYLACALGSGLASAGFHQLRSEPFGSSVGASGAICGLVGLLFAFSLRHRDQFLRDQLMQTVILLVVLSIMMPDVIDHAGHAGGFASGMAFGYFTPRYVSSTSQRRWGMFFWLSCAAAAASLAFAVWNRFQPSGG